MPNTWNPNAPSPRRALELLIEGNRRFLDAGSTSARTFRPDLAGDEQSPFAIVLGCSDSRTPVEILFDQGFGDLFVVRIAGNIVAPSVVGSIEFAAAQFGSRLVVVMGHTRCGAVKATLHTLASGQEAKSRNIRDVTDRIAPHVEELVHRGGPGDLVREATRANVRASADHLRHGSRVLEELVQSGRLGVVGAEYELETGIVHFFEGTERLPSS